MNKNHIYINVSLETGREIQKEKNFKPSMDYSIIEIMKLHPNEIGMFKTEFRVYHILAGTILEEKCPYCNCEHVIDSEEISEGIRAIYLKCQGCGARGPRLNYNATNSGNDMMVHLLRQSSSRRKAWDVNFLNPYREK